MLNGSLQRLYQTPEGSEFDPVCLLALAASSNLSLKLEASALPALLHFACAFRQLRQAPGAGSHLLSFSDHLCLFKGRAHQTHPFLVLDTADTSIPMLSLTFRHGRSPVVSAGHLIDIAAGPAIGVVCRDPHPVSQYQGSGITAQSLPRGQGWLIKCTLCVAEFDKNTGEVEFQVEVEIEVGKPANESGLVQDPG